MLPDGTIAFTHPPHIKLLSDLVAYCNEKSFSTASLKFIRPNFVKFTIPNMPREFVREVVLPYFKQVGSNRGYPNFVAGVLYKPNGSAVIAIRVPLKEFKDMERSGYVL